MNITTRQTKSKELYRLGVGRENKILSTEANTEVGDIEKLGKTSHELRESSAM